MENLGGLKIEKLSDNNFHIWKQKVEFVLAFRELDDVVKEPQFPENEDKNREWKKRDSKAMAIIGLTLSDEHLDHVRGLTSAADMWKALVNVFHRQTLLNKLNARRKFYTACMCGGERVLAYINRVRQLASDLRSMDVSVEDEDVAMTILCGLPERFEHLIVAIDTVSSDRPLSLDFVRSRLLQEEQLLGDRQNGPAKTDAALVSKPHVHRHCEYCGKEGHTEVNCWKKQLDEKSRYEKGRFRSSFRAKAALATQPAIEKSNSSDADSDDCVCLMADSRDGGGSASDTWHIDSGATSHMTHDRTLFETFEEGTPIAVEMGNLSRVKAHGHGTVVINAEVNGKATKGRLQDVMYVPDVGYHLISVSAIERNGGTVCFESGECRIMKGRRLVAFGTRIRGLYCLSTCSRPVTAEPSVALSASDLGLWHSRLGHVHPEGIKKHGPHRNRQRH